MKIVLLSRYFPPEIGTAANLFFELARGLAKKGHDVTVVTGFPWYNLEKVHEKYERKLFMEETMEGVRVIRTRFPAFGPTKLKLALGHITAPLSGLFGGLRVKKPDIILVYSPPLFMALSAWALSLIKRCPFVMGVQDLHPQCYIDQGILKNRLAISVLRAIEKFCYKVSSAITVHSEGNKRYIESRGIDLKKIFILHNWLDTDEMKPLPRHNEFSKKHGLDGRFIVGYAGTLGMSQGLLSVIEAANLLKEKKDIEFFIVGDGIEKEKMIRRSGELGIRNIRFLEMQTKDIYPWVVASCDVGLVTLNKKVKTPVVPSKILSMMAAGRPVLASLPLEGDAPKLIAESGCGICIEAEAPEKLAESVLLLSKDRALCERYGKQGREYVAANLSLKKVLSDIEKLFADIINRGGQ